MLEQLDDAHGIGQLIDALIDREGGYVDHPADRGGPTCFGITEAVARAHGYGGAMRNLPRREAVAIYRRLYWLRPRFDQVAARAPRLAAELFDTGANMGPAVAGSIWGKSHIDTIKSLSPAFRGSTPALADSLAFLRRHSALPTSRR